MRIFLLLSSIFGFYRQVAGNQPPKRSSWSIPIAIGIGPALDTISRGCYSLAFLLPLLLLSTCEHETATADAYGNFEAEEITVGAEATGRLLYLHAAEGRVLAAGGLIGLIDTTQLHLRKAQVLATIRALGRKTQDPSPQIAILEAQRRTLERDRDRVQALLEAEAATPKQLDDLNAQLSVNQQQINSARSQSRQTNQAILSEVEPLRAQLELLDEQIRKCYIYNPVGGTVLTQLADAGEIVAFGTPLYTTAPLDTLSLRAYVSGPQLTQLRIGQAMTVATDAADGSLLYYPGYVSWVADQAEFTPRQIQTREDRVDLVYAVKVRVPNDGTLKIGMPAELYFQPPGAISQGEGADPQLTNQ